MIILKSKNLFAHLPVVVRLNFLVVMGYLVAILVHFVHFPYLMYLFAPALYILPGLNIAFFVEQLSGQLQGITKIFSWAVILSLVITPVALLTIIPHFGGFTDRSLLLVFLMWWLMTLGIFWISLIVKDHPTTKLKWPGFYQYRVFWASVAVALIIVIVHFILYPFIPEADSYGYLMRINNLATAHSLSPVDTRPLFTLFAWGLSRLSLIDPYWLFKIILPFLSLCWIPIFYRYSQNVHTSWLKIICSIGFLTFPVVSAEILISRPQTGFMITLPIVLFLLVGLLKSKGPRSLYWFGLLLLITVLGSKMHELFIIATITVLISTAVFLYQHCKKYPLETVLLLAVVLGFVTPWVINYGIWGQIMWLTRPFQYFLAAPTFRWWFINSYVNVDGIQIGWPGYSWLLYYGYNIGLLVPWLILITVTHFKKPKYRPIQLPIAINLIAFLIIAELLPRFNIAFLPDRAWLFIALSLAFYIHRSVEYLEKVNLRWINAVTYAVVLMAIVSGWMVTYAKQGRVSRDEYSASQYLRQNTPQNSRVISQDSNNALIVYFGGRQEVVPPDDGFFMSDQAAPAKQFISTLFSIDAARLPDSLDAKNAKASLKTDLSDLLTANQKEDRDRIIQEIITERNNLERAYVDERLMAENNANSTPPTPMYILYSYDKFSDLYGTRDWWKKVNYFGANLNKFNQDSHFTKVFDNNKVIIWKYVQ